MPSIANITVKKNDGTTDIVWSATVPSAGDTTQAQWNSATVGTALSHQPTFRLGSRDSGAKREARRFDGQVLYPLTATAGDGSISVVSTAQVNVSAVLPKNMTQTAVAEAISQAVNLFASTLVKDSMKSGYAPT